MASGPQSGVLQRSLTKVNSYPSWIVFNVASFVVVAFCMLIAGPTFVRVARPANEADASIKLVNHTVREEIVSFNNLRLPPTENITPEGRIEVIWLLAANCLPAPCCGLHTIV